ncbi:MAG: hypothetical protein LBE49_02820 [Deltaproteobacteria bacterium]|jgi:hypothetical protein|nr:hypothetical protein [Deltaproteobacteria bacterium]
MPRLDLSTPQSYVETTLALANSLLAEFRSPAEVAEAEARINAYPGLEKLEPPKSIRVLEDLSGLEDLGRRAVLEGRVLWEHPAAGMALRLGLGPKFPLTPEVLARKAAGLYGLEGFEDLLPISLGLRHLLQPILEIGSLARQSGLDPAQVLFKQKVFLIVGEDSLDSVGRPALMALAKLVNPDNLWLMGQKAFHGLYRPRGGKWEVDPLSPKRLHNHGQMAMQKAMDGQILRLGPEGLLLPIERPRLEAVLDELDELVYFNIEDLDFLARAVDLESLGLAARLGRSGYGMVMELVANNPRRPIMGGMCAYDPALGRDVMIESFRLKDVAPKDILFLNKNFNHYPRPVKLVRRLREEGLFMPVRVADDRVHFQPVQGDLNFLTRTAFFTRREVRPLNSLKTAADIPAALEAMRRQDAQEGFKELAEDLLGG